jgi:hypothetical protein
MTSPQQLHIDRCHNKDYPTLPFYYIPLDIEVFCFNNSLFQGKNNVFTLFQDILIHDDYLHKFSQHRTPYTQYDDIRLLTMFPFDNTAHSIYPTDDCYEFKVTCEDQSNLLQQTINEQLKLPCDVIQQELLYQSQQDNNNTNNNTNNNSIKSNDDHFSYLNRLINKTFSSAQGELIKTASLLFDTTNNDNKNGSVELFYDQDDTSHQHPLYRHFLNNSHFSFAKSLDMLRIIPIQSYKTSTGSKPHPSWAIRKKEPDCYQTHGLFTSLHFPDSISSSSSSSSHFPINIGNNNNNNNNNDENRLGIGPFHDGFNNVYYTGHNPDLLCSLLTKVHSLQSKWKTTRNNIHEEWEMDYLLTNLQYQRLIYVNWSFQSQCFDLNKNALKIKQNENKLMKNMFIICDFSDIQSLCQVLRLLSDILVYFTYGDNRQVLSHTFPDMEQFLDKVDKTIAFFGEKIPSPLSSSSLSSSSSSSSSNQKPTLNITSNNNINNNQQIEENEENEENNEKTMNDHVNNNNNHDNNNNIDCVDDIFFQVSSNHDQYYPSEGDIPQDLLHELQPQTSTKIELFFFHNDKYDDKIVSHSNRLIQQLLHCISILSPLSIINHHEISSNDGISQQQEQYISVQNSINKFIFQSSLEQIQLDKQHHFKFFSPL